MHVDKRYVSAVVKTGSWGNGPPGTSKSNKIQHSIFATSLKIAGGAH